MMRSVATPPANGGLVRSFAGATLLHVQEAQASHEDRQRNQDHCETSQFPAQKGKHNAVIVTV
jgi:hypothetical protein